MSGRGEAAGNGPADAVWIQAVLVEYEAPLTRYARRITGDLDVARDVVQEAFLQLCRQRRSEVEDHVRPWLYRVCRQRAFDRARKQKRLRPLDVEQATAQACPVLSPYEQLELSDSAALVMRALGQLPDDQQEVVRLKFQDGLKYREIADITGHSASRVGVLIHQAVKQLRQRMRADIGCPSGE